MGAESAEPETLWPHTEMSYRRQRRGVGMRGPPTAMNRQHNALGHISRWNAMRDWCFRLLSLNILNNHIEGS